MRDRGCIMSGKASVVKAVESSGDKESSGPPLIGDLTERDLVELAQLPLTDLGNAERFVRRFGSRFMHVDAIGWLAWDGRRWNAQGAEAAVDRAAAEVARGIQIEAEMVRIMGDDFPTDRKDPPTMFSDKVASWGRASESAQKLRAIPQLARPKLTVPASDLDSDPMKINVENGTIHIVPGHDSDPIRLLPHDPEDRITKLAGVRYEPHAACPEFDRFLSRVQPSVGARRFLMQWLGHSLTGSTEEQKLVFMWGKGRNGKSTLIDTVADIAGDYGETVPIETFLDQGRGRNAGSATPDLAILPGVRLLRTSEPEKGAKLAEALIKLVTGGEPIQARHLNRDYFKFKPSFKLTISGNYRPQIAGADEGIWRRLMLVPWPVQIPAGERDLQLMAKLRAEKAGIFNRILDGLRDYLDGGLVIPSEVSDATQIYREDSDPLGRFLNVALRDEIGSRVQSSRLYSVFAAWARASGERVWSAKGFSVAMGERGYRKVQNNVIQWLDVKLVASEIDFEEAPPPHPGEADDDR